MSQIAPHRMADLHFQLKWNSGSVQHTDTYAAQKVKFWRDILPNTVFENLMGREAGDHVHATFGPGRLFANGTAQDIRKLNPRQFDTRRLLSKSLPPRVGRFYPKGVLKDISGIFSENIEPFRVLEVSPTEFAVDMGHPLAHQPLDLTVTVGGIQPGPAKWGGPVNLLVENLTAGLGMQGRWNNQPTEFFSDTPFKREDDTSDAIFYQSPRLVSHLDDTAREMVSFIYGRLLADDMHVLDLMSSWQSHLPDDISMGRVTGLGMNEAELARNERLTDFAVHDLNVNPHLPYPDEIYDAVVCTVSVEYLTAPQAVFAEVARVLRPNGVFAITFSNRWFSPKAIQLWAELSETERMGLVLEYFNRSNAFHQLQTYSVRGLPRPLSDKYAGKNRFSDPVYAVWGKKTN